MGPGTRPTVTQAEVASGDTCGEMSSDSNPGQGPGKETFALEPEPRMAMQASGGTVSEQIFLG